MSAKERLTADELTKLMEYFNEGLTYEEISLKLGRCTQTISSHIKALYEIGALVPREKRTRKRITYIEKPKKVKPKQKNVTHNGKICDAAFCKTCVYHNGDINKGLCNYSEITGLTRINRDNNADKGDIWECTKYQKIDKNHPWLHSKFDEMTL